MKELMSDLAELPRAAWILFAGTFINRFGSFVVPFLVLYLGARGYSATVGGLALGVYGIGHMTSSVVGGYLADRFGRRNTIVLSMFSSSVAMILMSQARTAAAIVVLAAVAGLAAELYRPGASALLSDLTVSGKRVIAFATYRLAINAGFAFGPATAGVLAKYSFTWLFVGDAITSAIFGLVALTMLPAGKRSTPENSGWTPALRHAFIDRRFVRFLVASALSAIVFFQFESTFALHVTDSGFSSAVYGVLVSLNGFTIIILELPIASFTRRFVRPRNVMAFGYVLVGFGFAMNIFAHTIPLLVVGVLLWTFGEMVMAPLGGAYVADLAPDELRGRYMGMWAITWSVGLSAGPALGTLLYAQSPRAVWVLCLVLALLAAALMYERPDTLRPAA